MARPHTRIGRLSGRIAVIGDPAATDGMRLIPRE
jgi:hypothetical protein